jgi:membrane-anchored protein YejM (alkaline phosphatase superfamily)
MDMSAGMWVMAAVMMVMMLVGMVGVAWSTLRRRLRGRDRH